MEDSELVTVGNYVRLPEAELAQGILDEAGIESIVVDENVGRMLTWIVTGGFKVQVNKENADSAIRLLNEPGPRPAETSGAPQGRCPNCDSPDIALQQSESPVACTGNSLLAPVQPQIYERSWECKSCGYCWDSPGRGGPASDLASITTAVGAPSFAFFAKGGSRERVVRNEAELPNPRRANLANFSLSYTGGTQAALFDSAPPSAMAVAANPKPATLLLKVDPHRNFAFRITIASCFPARSASNMSTTVNASPVL